MINNIIIVSVLSVAILLFPVFLNVNLYIDLNDKKGWFSFYILHSIKIYGGYASLYKEGIAFHLTDRKAVLLPYGDMVNMRQKFEITRGFRLLTYSHVIEIGLSDHDAQIFAAAVLLRRISDFFGTYFIVKKNCQSFHGDIVVRCGENCAKASIHFVLFFNLIILMIAIFKILLGKIMEKFAEHERKIKQKSE